MAVRRGRFGGQRLALGDGELEGDQVDAVDGFGDGVFDLEAGVHLQEVRLPVGDEELDGAGAGVADGAGGGGGGLVQSLAQGVGQAGRGGFLDHLLVAALEGAVAGAERPDGAVPVAEDLHLDVAARGQVGLDEDLAVAEGGERFGGGRLQGGGQLVQGLDDAHPASAAAGRRLDEDGQDVLGDGAGVERPEERHSGVGHEFLGAGLGGHRLDRLGVRPDPGEPGVLDGAGEAGVLGEEAVPGVDGVGPGGAGGGDHEIGAQVGVGRAVAGEPDGGVGLADVGGGGVGVGVDGDGGEAQVVAGAQDAAGYLAPVGDEDARQRGGGHGGGPHIRKTPKPPRAPSTGAVWTADRHRPSTVRVSRGSMTPSS